jgi:hypothetical protein
LILLKKDSWAQGKIAATQPGHSLIRTNEGMILHQFFPKLFYAANRIILVG